MTESAQGTLQISEELVDKEQRLVRVIKDYGSMLLAYSGGVDSAYLAEVATQALAGKAQLLIADSPSVPRAELREALDLAKKRKWSVCTLKTRELDHEVYLRNGPHRCYHCRVELFSRMRACANELGLDVIAYGSNADDAKDPARVGALAAQEMGVKAPLEEAGLSKQEVRMLSRARNLPTADKASFACLASRVPTGTPITTKTLSKIEQVESALMGLGFHQYRARHHGDLCRIEVELDDFGRLLDEATRQHIMGVAREAGYKHVALDLAGYRTGSTSGPRGASA